MTCHERSILPMDAQITAHKRPVTATVIYIILRSVFIGKHVSLGTLRGLWSWCMHKKWTFMGLNLSVQWHHWTFIHGHVSVHASVWMFKPTLVNVHLQIGVFKQALGVFSSTTGRLGSVCRSTSERPCSTNERSCVVQAVFSCIHKCFQWVSWNHFVGTW